MVEKITITIYYSNNIDKEKQIDRFKKMIDDCNNIEFVFFEWTN